MQSYGKSLTKNRGVCVGTGGLIIEQNFKKKFLKQNTQICFFFFFFIDLCENRVSKETLKSSLADSVYYVKPPLNMQVI